MEIVSSNRTSTDRILCCTLLRVLNSRMRPTSSWARSAARWISPAWWADGVPGRALSAAISACPRMAPITLLKLWAMPLANVPTASRRLARLSLLSSSIRSRAVCRRCKACDTNSPAIRTVPAPPRGHGRGGTDAVEGQQPDAVRVMMQDDPAPASVTGGEQLRPEIASSKARDRRHVEHPVGCVRHGECGPQDRVRPRVGYVHTGAAPKPHGLAWPDRQDIGSIGPERWTQPRS
jgi:hypothetical protein